MQKDRLHWLLGRIVAFTVLLYGLLIIAGTLVRQLQTHRHHDFDAIFVSVPALVGISYVYLASLLFRLKYNAWLMAIVLSVAVALFNAFSFNDHIDHMGRLQSLLRVVLPLVVTAILLISRRIFRVQSDLRTFTEAVRLSVAVLLITFLYGVGGYCLLDARDFHQEISLGTAMHQTIDQFGLTTTSLVPHTRRAKLFTDSLSAISTAAVAYVALSFFQPLRVRFTNQTRQRELARQLLNDHPGDIDDFFKLWPHDKQYYFDTSARAGLAYHVSRGVALVVGDPFGDPKHFKPLFENFHELCFVNDWTPSFIHVNEDHLKLYRANGYTVQKIGEEAVLELPAFEAVGTNKYFRQIRNRFTKLGYSVELLQPPHSQALLNRLTTISDEWLQLPGRDERGFMLGYYSDEYMQAGPVAVVRDDAQQIQGFMNIVPTYLPETANYDLLRCATKAPGNCNDFLVMGTIGLLQAQGFATLNLGLCPLSGLDKKTADFNLIDSTLRFAYANGDRLYSFSGLRRFKAKYEPEWHDRYIAYQGGIAGFTRTIAALNRAMKVKK